MDGEFKLVKLHDYPEMVPSCVKLLNDEWPRNQNIRLYSLEQSRDTLPVSLILVGNNFQLYGHVKLKSHLPVNKNSVFLESLVVDKEFRGKGLGKFIMKETEIFVKNLGYNQIVLTATDQNVAFYRKLNYEIVDQSPKSFKNSTNKNNSSQNDNSQTYVPPPTAPTAPPAPPPPPLPSNVQKITSTNTKTLLHKFI